MALSGSELKRYQRQMMMEGWGETGQARLKASTAFIAGAGGLGSPVSIYLAVAGVGHLRVCDFDAPELSNLNRQILHDTTRIGVNKAVSAKQTLERLNPDVRVTALTEKITGDTVDGLVGNSAIILDCMDNYPTRYLLNECAFRKGIPMVHGSIWGMEGRLTFIQAPETPCLRCLFPDPPPPGVFPVLGATPAVIGSMQALEAVKHLTGIGATLKGRLLAWDGSEVTFHTYRMRKDPNCPVCGRG